MYNWCDILLMIILKSNLENKLNFFLSALNDLEDMYASCVTTPTPPQAKLQRCWSCLDL